LKKIKNSLENNLYGIYIYLFIYFNNNAVKQKHVRAHTHAVE